MKSTTLARRAARTLSLAALMVLSACATTGRREADDPLEPMNRAMFSFNEGLDRNVAKPVASAYAHVMPEPLQTAVGNLFSNLGDVGNFVNDLLQLKVADATEDLMRFAMNSTFGLGGLLDWATPAGLPKHHEDFGLTLGHYGVPSGPYLVLPLFGPSSVRDASGLLVSSALNPTTFMPLVASTPLFGVNVVSTRSHMLGATDLLEMAALDKYSFVRDGYLQSRANALDERKTLPDYDDPSAQGGGQSQASK
ncbi:VacJ family lipoprotein [Paraburkholderia sp. Ac-20347]|nr:VacJ family lipoprotein [Paraburkholderia sp. Ac-20347]